MVVDPPAAQARSQHRFIARAASLGGHAGAPMSVSHDVWRAHPPMLGKPAAMVA